MDPSLTVTTQEITQLIQEATESVFSTMLQISVVPRPVYSAQGDPAPFDGVVTLVGIAGDWTGIGRIYCSAEFACRMAGALLMAEYRAIDPDVLDGMAEIGNMIIGNLKTGLESRLGPLALSVPTVIYGRNYQARTPASAEWIVVPFECDGEEMEVRFFLARTSASRRLPHARHEPVTA